MNNIMIEKIEETVVLGCFKIKTKVFEDERGLFVKTFHKDIFKEYGLETDFPETVYSVSKKNVLRGLHFQKPPCDHVKVVSCVAGSVFDVGVDLRQGSPTFGKHAVFELRAGDGNLIYFPKGIAHGFLALEENSVVAYKTSTVYSPERDSGILWSSCGIDWKTDVEGLIISFKDRNLRPFAKDLNIFQ